MKRELYWGFSVLLIIAIIRIFKLEKKHIEKLYTLKNKS